MISYKPKSGPLDRIMVPQGAKVEAPGLPKSRFWAPEKIVCVGDVPLMRGRSARQPSLHKQAGRHFLFARAHRGAAAEAEKLKIHCTAQWLPDKIFENLEILKTQKS